MDIKNERTDKDKIETFAINAHSGDKFSFVELTGIFSPYISSLARKYRLPESEYDDLCQTGRIALYNAVCNYDISRNSFTTFARTCIKNAMISFVREYISKNKKTTSNISIEEIDAESLPYSVSVTPEDTFIAKEFARDLSTAVKTILTESEKTVLLHKLSGIGTTEISVLIGKDTKSVENTLFRARKKLKKYFDKK